MSSPRLHGVVRTVLGTSAALLLVWLNPVMGQSGDGCGGNMTGLYLDLGMKRNVTGNLDKVINSLVNGSFDQKCLNDSEHNPTCMCGEQLSSTQEAMTLLLNLECSSELDSSEAATLSSELDFCGPALYKLGYNVTVERLEDIKSGAEFCPSATFTSNESLHGTIQSLKNWLQMFEAVLDRTIVGVYLRSREQRCACLEAYKQWLCATKLPLHMMSGSNSTQLKPCIGVCHKVLQRCPYYLPSKFQPPNGPQGRSFPVTNPASRAASPEIGQEEREGPGRNMSLRDREVIYGGYPAFDCPSSQMLNGSSSYAIPGSLCIGNRAWHVTGTSSLMALLVLLTIFSVAAIS